MRSYESERWTSSQCVLGCSSRHVAHIYARCRQEAGGARHARNAPRQVLASLRLVDASINHAPTGWLHKADVKTALAGFFKGAKRVDRLDEVRVWAHNCGVWGWVASYESAYLPAESRRRFGGDFGV